MSPATCLLLLLLLLSGITDKATLADVEAELADLDDLEPSWELPAELQEYRCVC
jgi:outer membrane lipoprotein-sorting protein